MGLKNRIIGYLPMSKRRLLKELKEVKSQNDQQRESMRALTGMLKVQAKKLDAQDKRLAEQKKAIAAQRELLDSYKRLLNTQGELLEQLRDTQARNRREVEQTLGDRVAKAEANLRGILEQVRKKQLEDILWSNEFERAMVLANWGDVTTDDSFAERFTALTSGMDAASVAEVIKIVSRLHKYLSTDAHVLDLFTSEEKDKIRKLHEDFACNIIELADDLYAYNGYYLPVGHFESSVFYYKHGIEKLKQVESVRGRDIIDVGGFVGDSILVLNEMGPRRIISFEADPGNYALMQRTLSLNGVTNAVTVNMALGDENGVASFHSKESMSSTVVRNCVEYESEFEVPVVTLDSYLEDSECDIALIKVDIEGAEPLFLKGAYQTIKKHRPIILLSIYHNAHDFFELKPMIESWDLDYTFSIFKPVFESITGETLLLCEPA